MIAVRAARIEGNRAAALAALLLLGIAAEIGLGDALASGKTNLVTLVVVAATFALSFAFLRQAVYGVLVIVFVEV